MTKTTGVALGALLMAFGCSTTSKTTKMEKGSFDESRIAGVPAAQKPEVGDAKAALDEAQLELESARRTAVESENRVRLAEGERNLAKTEEEQAKRTAKLAVDRGEIASIDENRVFREARIAHDTADAKLKYLKALEDYEKAQVKHHEAVLDLRKAEVDAAGFAVLQRVDPKQVSSMGIYAADYTARVEKMKAEVANANAKVASRRAKTVPLYEAWGDLDRQLGKTSHRATAPPAPPAEN